MFYGELALHTPEYQWGHHTGSVRAYDDAIMWFEEVLANEKKGTKHTTSEVISMLKNCKVQWLLFCEKYGLADTDIDFDTDLASDADIDFDTDLASDAKE